MIAEGVNEKNSWLQQCIYFLIEGLHIWLTLEALVS